MRESILKFAEEFAWDPIIEKEALLARREKVIVAGMGGSPLAADLLNAFDPALNIVVHKDYGLPLLDDSGSSMVVAISYSGNTEETLDAFEKAGEKGITRVAISTGGKLLERAREEQVAYVQLPPNKIQPRMALGFIIKTLAALLGLNELKKETTQIADLLKPAEFEEPGRLLASRIGNRIPLIYSSTRNRAIAYNWKIKFNEIAKIPAFYNVFPELNHNEMNAPSSQCYTIILRDPDDHPRIQKRMEVMTGIYEEKKIPIEIVNLSGAVLSERVFSSLLLADWAALAIAESRGVDPSEVPIVEEFKNKL